MKPSARTLVAGIVMAIVAAAIAGGFLIAGPPSEARLRRLDSRRVSDLRQLSAAVNLQWTRAQRLPPSLDEVIVEQPWNERPADPTTAQPYEYRKAGDDRYELCAAFDRPSEDGPRMVDDPFWSHSSGRYCFTLTPKDLKR